ncbi:hypothetical protein [Nocardia paucivorans]|uniref:hypothetical protein n=1 Tax=Nocardia paucivorans TaxID=114259 RepID=UPI000311BA70|nr:hypothetical protein [Nocardia paucivorans]
MTFLPNITTPADLRRLRVWTLLTETRRMKTVDNAARREILARVAADADQLAATLHR